MRIFTGLAHILNADTDAMVDTAADSERMARLMAQELEDTLVEIKASCAAAMAARARAQRAMDGARAEAGQWDERARLAVQKRRDQLAREALVHRRRYTDRAEALAKEAAESDALVRRCQDDMEQVEGKLSAVREKQRLLLERRIRARREGGPQVATPPPPAAGVGAPSDVAADRVVRVSVEAGPAAGEREPQLEQEFERLATDEDVEKELQALKDAIARKGDEGPASQ